MIIRLLSMNNNYGFVDNNRNHLSVDKSVDNLWITLSGMVLDIYKDYE
jgi:hypothetical protein